MARYERRDDDQKEIDYCLNCTLPAHLCHGSCGGEFVRKRQYIVCLKNRYSGEEVFRGTNHECANFLGLAYKQFMNAKRSSGHTRGYKIERVTG